MYTQEQIQKQYARWLETPMEDAALLDELLSVKGDEEAIKDRFYRELEFGTGGLRGVLGAGVNRMNIYTVAKATQGFANDLLKHFDAPSVCISYDSRNNSTLFAKTAAGVFAANGVKVYIYPELMPTPALSFAVRKKGASGGVMVTASHNPAKYNGYKVYGSDGCQMTIEAADRVLAEIEALDIFEGAKKLPFEEGLNCGMIEYIGEDVFDAFIAAVSAQGVNLATIDKSIPITYTPLNGAGRRCITTALARNGFTNISLVPSQAEPDGNFPTCPYPNPEIREALEEGLRCAKENGSELLIATDPDCDRMGIAVREGEDFRLLSGNEVGVLLLDYICSQRIKNGTMPEAPVAVKTIVTTEMAVKVCAHYAVALKNVLTGFKFIGEQIALLEEDGHPERYIFGFEESYGYLSGSYVRDKDAVNAALLTAEMFAYYRGEGRSLLEVLASLYARFGYYENALDNFAFEGASGFATMGRIMDGLRSTPPAMPGYKLASHTDYRAQKHTFADGTSEPTGLPASNVLRFSYEGGVSVIVRPSGTEPKLKIYYSIEAESKESAKAVLDEVRGFFGELVKGY